jgi:hypothetical protein
MKREILRRCSLCGKFHASYLVSEHPGGKGYYCYTCWKATYAVRSRLAQDQMRNVPVSKDGM